MLTVESIRLSGFMTHEHSFVELPKTGIVLVAGVNGAGKSALIEAVAFACWGKTLRGREPWTSSSALAGITTPDLWIERWPKTLRFGSSPAQTDVGAAISAQFRLDDVSHYPTLTKAQEALDPFLPDPEVWRRSCVFSSGDLQGFSEATDSERKRLLERLLDLERFDTALEACRSELKERSAELAKLEAARTRAGDKLEAARARVVRAQAQAERTSADPPAEPPTREGLSADELLGLLRRSEEDVRKVDERMRRATRVAATATTKARSLERQLTALKGEVCPTCGATAPIDVLERLRREASAATEEAQKLERAGEADEQAARDELEELREETEALRRRERAARTEDDRAAGVRELIRQWKSARDAAAAELTEAEEARDAAEVDLADAMHKAAEVATEVAVLDATARVLGVKGVRASILARTLDGLEGAVNARLVETFGTDLRVTLRASKEKKTGGVSDVLDMSISGAGDGTYKSLSQGQRRRIDLGLLLGLSDLATARAGAKPGTLFLDEVFDTLDSAGIEAVGDIAATLAQDRCVVVMTHVPELAERLRPQAQVVYRVTAGEVERSLR